MYFRKTVQLVINHMIGENAQSYVNVLTFEDFSSMLMVIKYSDNAPGSCVKESKIIALIFWLDVF